MSLIVVTSAGCASEFERRLEEAEQLRVAAAEAGAEWLQTGDLLDAAREAAAAGDEAAALAHVDEAKFQAEAAIRQAEREAEIWQHRVIR